MDIKQLKAHLIDNIDYVEEFLNTNFHNIKYYDSSCQWRFGLTEDCDPSSIKLSAKDLSYVDFKNNESGDLLSLIMRKFKINLGKCLDILKNKSNYIETHITRKIAYNGIYSKMSLKSDEYSDFYTENDINTFPEIVSKFMLKEGLTIESQKVFNIRYDYMSGRIVIPVYQQGKLYGAIGRYNKTVFDKAIPKYLPILNYPKYRVLFGYDINYSNMYNSRIYVVESEKTVIKAWGEGFRNLVALGGNHTSDFQKSLLYSLHPTEIVVVLDKGLGKDRAIELGVNVDNYLLDRIKSEANSIKSKNIFFNVKVGYINCNCIEEVTDGDNVFDIEHCNVDKYINNIEYV